MQHATGNLHDYALLILNQGMRSDEVFSLRKEDVGLDCGVVHVRRGKSRAARRTLRLTEEVKLILARRLVGPSP